MLSEEYQRAACLVAIPLFPVPEIVHGTQTLSTDEMEVNGGKITTMILKESKNQYIRLSWLKTEKVNQEKVVKMRWYLNLWK